MYIEKYWDNYIGGSDDSMTLMELLAQKSEEEVSLKEIFEEIGLDKLSSFKSTEGGLTATIDDMDVEFQNAISVIADLAAIILECRENGKADLNELCDMEGTITLVAEKTEMELINSVLKDFVSAPDSFDIAEMMDEDELSEMAEIFEELKQELFE